MSSLHHGVKSFRRFSSVGFIGLGKMGSRMARNLIKKYNEVHVYDTDNTAGNVLAKEGAQLVKHIDSLSSQDCIISMLPSGHEVFDVFYGNDDNGLLSKLARKSIIIDCSTIHPDVVKRLSEAAAARDILFMDAPVSGGIGAASSGELTFMVGGTAEGLKRIEPILRSMGQDIIYCGSSGSGQMAKICNNMLLAVSMIATAEAMNLGVRLGLDAMLLAKVINSSSGKCWSSSNYNPVPGVTHNAPANREYQGGFASRLLLKDLKIAFSIAEQNGAYISLGKQALDVYSAICQQGDADMDFSIIYKHLKTYDGTV